MREATARVSGTYLDCNCTADATGLDMRALAVRPGQSNSGRLLDVLEPSLADGAPLIPDVVTRSAPSGIVCLAGVSSGGHILRFDLGDMNRQLVLENDVVFGSVDANRSHYELAATALTAADPTWLSRLITRRVPLADWQHAFVRQPDDIKVIIDFDGGA